MLNAFVLQNVLFLFPMGDLIIHPYEIREVAVSDDLRKLTNLSLAIGVLLLWLTSSSVWQ